ncbi:presequence protease, mitochondrial [Cephus cinctus]|uniref:Presequence protease, mitochondrial n=1 Tax=Cephus cinctus TaxID=211228 RepID=A0AAJ7FPP1_CEPCN|nr:presequence protease, mitochondrial [Cephus cinctus]
MFHLFGLSKKSQLIKPQLQKKVYRLCNFHTCLNAYVNSTSTQFSTQENAIYFKEGVVIQGFAVEEVSKIEEMHLTAIRLRHITTRAKYLHLDRDDSNNVFSIGFRTTPMDSTGLPHILEHTTLCGSEKYPCRDPFFKMLRRSLATFMNAMTGPDYTIYPFSTQNLKDFKNLQSVYLDSVFKPNLRELDFHQEGWRLEHADINDKNSRIIFQGVVFNEMKGAFSENQTIFAEKLLNLILPSHTYSVISGGDPLVIPNLTYEDLLKFHAKYYHPSNSRIFSYGNFPLEHHLRYLNETYLASIDEIDSSMSAVPPENRWQHPRKEHITCRPDPMAADSNRQNSIAIAHLCNDITDIQATFELHVLSKLLLSGPTSAFYKSLIESSISTSFSPVTGYDSQCRDTMFVVGLQGVKSEDFERVEEVFKETVKKVIVEGFEKDHVEAVLHGIELDVKHQSSNFGLNLLFNLTPLWNHNGNIIQSMRINESVTKLKESLKQNPRHFENLVEKYLARNSHRLVLTMSPDERTEQKIAAAENNILKRKLEALSEDDLQKIYDDGQKLLAEQQKKEDVDVLPTLTIQDIKKDIERYEIKDLKIHDVPLQMSIQPTNGVCYYRAIVNTRDISLELKDLVPLFNSIVTKMGTKNYDYRSFDRIIHLKTGGLSLSNHVAEDKNNVLRYEEGVFLHSYSLDRNTCDMWQLWIELFNNVRLTDLSRFETLVKITAADLANGIADSGHIYAMSSAASLVSPGSRRKESLSGLQFVQRMKKIAQTQNLSPILEQMQQIAQHILNKTYLRSAINLSADNADSILKNTEKFYFALKGTPKNVDTFAKQQNSPENNAIHHVLPFPVNYTSKAILTVPYTHPDFAPTRVLSQLVTSTYLHPEVREKGGAYGGGARLSPNGIFSFYSYRDPNSIRTFDLFDKTYEFLKKYSFVQQDIDEAKLGVFQQVDAPVPPGSRGITKFINQLSDDEIQKHREDLKSVNKEQLMEVAEKYLNPDNKNVTVGRSLLGPVNTDLLNRTSEKWVIFEQEEEGQAQAAH